MAKSKAKTYGYCSACGWRKMIDGKCKICGSVITKTAVHLKSPKVKKSKKAKAKVEKPETEAKDGPSDTGPTD
ncbi:hypothetical protein KAR91_84360 [Candidatus Pacearchaeota archaeon]|nr:hypothetical protein [Candidatus Pacearchaeota archaeon]